MKELTGRDASALSLLAEYPNEDTKALVLADLSPEARKIADAMVPPKKPVRRKTKGATAKGRKRAARRPSKSVQAAAEALLRWSK